MACFHLKLNQLWTVTVSLTGPIIATASMDDITELCFALFDEIMLPWQALKIAKSKSQPDDPLLMGLGHG